MAKFSTLERLTHLGCSYNETPPRRSPVQIRQSLNKEDTMQLHISDNNDIDTDKLSLNDLIMLQYEMANAIRQRRVRTVNAALAAAMGDGRNGHRPVSSVVVVTAANLAREITGPKRHVFIDEYLDVLEIALDISPAE